MEIYLKEASENADTMIEDTANIEVAVDTSMEKKFAVGILEGRNVTEKAVGTDTQKCANSG